jgi:hypothetical protein
VAVPNDTAGNDFLDVLRKDQGALGFHFAGTLDAILGQLGVERAGYADEMIDKFAFLDILPGFQFAVMGGILKHGCSTKSPVDPFPNNRCGARSAYAVLGDRAWPEFSTEQRRLKAF